MQASALLRTKLHSPEPRAGSVARPRLLSRLDESLHPGHRLALICGPAGYGKTTLVRQWLMGLDVSVRGSAAAAAPAAGQSPAGGRASAARQAVPSPRWEWLTLDSADNDIARFSAYLAAALEQVEPGSWNAPAVKHEAAPPESPFGVATALLNSMAASGAPRGPAIIVLDDYQQIQAPAVHELVGFLVEGAPSHVRWVIVTREDPPLGLSRLRARGQLTEVREADLRFTVPEAALFLNGTMRLGLTDSEVEALAGRTEGWAAGLQLAGLSLRGREAADRIAFVADFSGSHRYVIDYLIDEVLRRQPPETRRFLCQTAVLGRFCPALCDAVTGREDSRDMLAHLDRANLFVIPLDDRREWYRYHSLFAGCLDALLTEGERAALHRRAAGWFEARDLAAEAAGHALAGGDGVQAARLVRRMAPELIARGELEGLLRWLDALSANEIRDDIELTVFRAWALFLTGRLKDAAAAVRPMLPRLPAEGDRDVRAQLLVLLSWLANFEDQVAASARMAGEALDLTAGGESLVRVVAFDLLGEAQVRLGAGTAGTRSFREGIALAERLNHSFAAVAMTYNLAMNLNRQGRRAEAVSVSREGIGRYLDARGVPRPVADQLYLPLALLSYEANELEEARDHLGKGLESPPQGVGLNRVLLVDGPWLKVRLALAAGDAQAALATARYASQSAREAGHARAAHIMAACEAQAQLRLGDTEAAIRWAVDAGLWDRGPARPLAPGNELVDLVLAGLFLETGRLLDAKALLTDMEAAALEGDRYGRLIRINLLESAAEMAASSRAKALGHLVQAVRLAAPEGYVRAFLDEGAPVAGLLPEVQGKSPAFVAAVIKAAAGHRDDHIPSSPDRLTEQETRILRLLAAGMSNSEIAAELVIKAGTVKWHVHNIYCKLGAGHRAQAVARARARGLLT